MNGRYNTRSPAVKRLMREAQELSEPTDQYFAQPLEDNLFEWHFTVRGPADSDFQNGIFHGRIILPVDYPMKPPSIIWLTPNGRFETNKKICLSISGHHPESWQPSWSIRTALLAIIGFMPTHPGGAIGSLDYTPEERKTLAKKSKDWKCPTCGDLKGVLLEASANTKQTSDEAKQLAAQINLQGEKPKCKDGECPIEHARKLELLEAAKQQQQKQQAPSSQQLTNSSNISTTPHSATTTIQATTSATSAVTPNGDNIGSSSNNTTGSPSVLPSSGGYSQYQSQPPHPQMQPQPLSPYTTQQHMPSFPTTQQQWPPTSTPQYPAAVPFGYPTFAFAGMVPVPMAPMPMNMMATATPPIPPHFPYPPSHYSYNSHHHHAAAHAHAMSQQGWLNNTPLTPTPTTTTSIQTSDAFTNTTSQSPVPTPVNIKDIKLPAGGIETNASSANDVKLPPGHETANVSANMNRPYTRTPMTSPIMTPGSRSSHSNSSPPLANVDHLDRKQDLSPKQRGEVFNELLTTVKRVGSDSQSAANSVDPALDPALKIQTDDCATTNTANTGTTSAEVLLQNLKEDNDNVNINIIPKGEEVEVNGGESNPNSESGCAGKTYTKSEKLPPQSSTSGRQKQLLTLPKKSLVLSPEDANNATDSDISKSLIMGVGDASEKGNTTNATEENNSDADAPPIDPDHNSFAERGASSSTPELDKLKNNKIKQHPFNKNLRPRQSGQSITSTVSEELGAAAEQPERPATPRQTIEAVSGDTGARNRNRNPATRIGGLHNLNRQAGAGANGAPVRDRTQDYSFYIMIGLLAASMAILLNRLASMDWDLFAALPTLNE